MPEPDVEAYQRASTAFHNMPWASTILQGDWDGYWFESERRLELYFNENRPFVSGDILAPLQPTGATDVLIGLQPRSGVPHVSIGQRINVDLTIELPEETEALRVTSSDLVRFVQVNIDQPEGSAVLHADTTSTTGYMTSVTVSAASSKEFHFTDLHIGFGNESEVFQEVFATDCTVGVGEGSTVTCLWLAGRCPLRSTINAIETLVATGGSTVVLGTHRQPVSPHVGNLKAALSLSNGGAISLEGAGQLIVTETAADVLVDIADKEATLAVRHAKNLRVSGVGVVQITESATVLGFPDADSASTLRLDAEASAVIYDAWGTIRLGQVSHAEIQGAQKERLEIHSIVPMSGEPDPPTDGLLLRNFQVPISLAGLRTIRALTDTAAVTVPRAHDDLPGHRKERNAAKQGRHDDADRFRADFARAIARMAETGGAPGSIVTRLAWQEYRMRQATADPWEQAFLWAYSRIGYGERALPALGAYAVLAFVFSTIALWHADASIDLSWIALWHADASIGLSWAGLERCLASFRDWLLAPLHVLRLGSIEAQTAAEITWESALGFLGRIALAIPLITGALALRKYVKRTHET